LRQRFNDNFIVHGGLQTVNRTVAFARATTYEKKWISNKSNTAKHGRNMGTVLIFHFISFMKYKNRPHVAFLFESGCPVAFAGDLQSNQFLYLCNARQIAAVRMAAKIASGTPLAKIIVSITLYTAPIAR